MRELLIFVPSIEDGGVEKNLFLIANYLSNNGIKTNVVTANLDKKKRFDKKINFISPNSNFLNKKNRFYKTIFCFYLLLKFFITTVSTLFLLLIIILLNYYNLFSFKSLFID